MPADTGANQALIGHMIDQHRGAMLINHVLSYTKPATTLYTNIYNIQKYNAKLNAPYTAK